MRSGHAPLARGARGEPRASPAKTYSRSTAATSPEDSRCATRERATRPSRSTPGLAAPFHARRSHRVNSSAASRASASVPVCHPPGLSICAARKDASTRHAPNSVRSTRVVPDTSSNTARGVGGTAGTVDAGVRIRLKNLPVRLRVSPLENPDGIGVFWFLERLADRPDWVLHWVRGLNVTPVRGSEASVDRRSGSVLRLPSSSRGGCPGVMRVDCGRRGCRPQELADPRSLGQGDVVGPAIDLPFGPLGPANDGLVLLHQKFT